MSNRILFELLPNEIRVVTARGSSRVWEIADSFSVEMKSDWQTKDAVEALRAAFGTRSIPARGDLDVVVGRRDVEIREIGLPPAPDNELPEMVRFTARNEFTQVSDSTLLDFAPLRGDAENPRTVIAATLHAEAATVANGLASGLGLRLKRILVRPWCVAHSVVHQLNPEHICLLVEDVGESVEMTLWNEGHLMLTRTFRTGESTDESAQTAIADELQRTLMVSARAKAGRVVDDLVVIGDSSRLSLEQNKNFPKIIRVVPASTRSHAGKGSGRDAVFSAHRGALNFLEKPAGDMLDFQNPRRVVKKQTDWKRVGLWASAAVIIVLGSLIGAWLMLASQSRTIARMESELAELKKANEPDGKRPGVEQIMGEVGTIDNWMANSVNWLDEMQQISDRMMTPDDAIVDDMRMESGEATSKIAMKGHLAQNETGTEVKTSLASRPFSVDPGPTKIDAKSKDYPVMFEYSLGRDLDTAGAIGKISDRARELLLNAKSAAAATDNTDSGKTSQESSAVGNADSTPPTK